MHILVWCVNCTKPLERKVNADSAEPAVNPPVLLPHEVGRSHRISIAGICSYYDAFMNMVDVSLNWNVRTPSASCSELKNANVTLCGRIVNRPFSYEEGRQETIIAELWEEKEKKEGLNDGKRRKGGTVHSIIPPGSRPALVAHTLPATN